MNFVNPGAMFWLLPLAGVLVLLYLLKMRRKELQVPASFLWPKLTYEVRANSLFQRLRFSWLLVLQLLALALVVAAFARPQVRARSLTGEVTVLVIDTSATMSAIDVKPTRLGEALRVAGRFVDAVRPGDRLSVIEAGLIPRVVFPLSDDQGRMRLALSTVQSSDAQADVGEALRLASSLVAKSDSAKIVLLSDGVFPDIANFSAGRANLVFQKIGESDDNAAIAALGVTDSTSGPQLYCGLKNYGSRPSLGVLNIYADGNLINSLKVEVPKKGTLGKTMPVPAGAKVFEAKLQNGDMLPSDNYAVALRDSGALNVLLVSKGDLFLERALSLDPRVTLYKSSSVPASGTFDLVVFDGVQETPVRAAGVLTFGLAGANSPVKVTGTSNKVQVKNQEASSELLRGVSFSDTFIAQSQTVQLGAGAQQVVEGSSGPLVVTSKGPQRHIYVGFTPLDSDLPLHVGFPILVGNAISFLVPKESTNSALTVPAGRTIALPATTADLTIETPGGQLERVQSAHGQYILRNLNHVGRYVIDSKPKRNLYVTFGSEAQSNIAPVEKLMAGSIAASASNVTSRLTDWWKPLALLALLVLGVEWFVFMRRS